MGCVLPHAHPWIATDIGSSYPSGMEEKPSYHCWPLTLLARIPALAAQTDQFPDFDLEPDCPFLESHFEPALAPIRWPGGTPSGQKDRPIGCQGLLLPISNKDPSPAK